jgi:hypothetical protein
MRVTKILGEEAFKLLIKIFAARPSVVGKYFSKLFWFLVLMFDIFPTFFQPRGGDAWYAPPPTWPALTHYFTPHYIIPRDVFPKVCAVEHRCAARYTFTHKHNRSSKVAIKGLVFVVHPLYIHTFTHTHIYAHIWEDWYVFGSIKKTSYGIEENLYLLYIFPPELHTHLWLRCSNFFNTSKKKIILVVLQIRNRKSQRRARARVCVCIYIYIYTYICLCI